MNRNAIHGAAILLISIGALAGTWWLLASQRQAIACGAPSVNYDFAPLRGQIAL